MTPDDELDIDDVIDLSALDYDRWLKVMFESEWTWHGSSMEITDPAVVLDHFIRMCSGFSEIAQTYSWTQINNAIWRTFDSAKVEPPITKCLIVPLPGIKINQQLSAIEAIYHVYADFVALSTVSAWRIAFTCGGMIFARPSGGMPQQRG